MGVGKWTALDVCPSKALEVLVLLKVTHNSLEVSLLSLEVSHNSLEVSYNSLEVSHSSLEVSHNSLEVSHSSLEPTLLDLEATHHNLGAILPNKVTILKWSSSKEAIQCSQEHIQGRLQAIHHLHLATPPQVKFQQQLLQLEQQG